MFPGVRIGFMTLDKTLSNAVVNNKAILNHKVNDPMLDAIAHWMRLVPLSVIYVKPQKLIICCVIIWPRF